jgi:rhodanese-related sulfurtransferase
MAQAGGFQRIDVATAREIMDRGGSLVLDVRDADSYGRGHIEGSALATKENFQAYVQNTPKTAPLIICCYHGNSSQTYAKYFADNGFTDVYSLDGGYEAWEHAERMAPKPAAVTAPATALSPELEALLAEHGFQPGVVNQHNKDNATPLMIAVRLAPPALVKELLAAGADVHAVNADGNQALWLACVTEAEENIQLLIDAGIDVQHINFSGATPLMFAASSARAKATAILVKAGADPMLETDLPLSALDMASSVECLNIMRDAIKRRKAS